MEGPVKDVEVDSDSKEDKIQDPSKEGGEVEEGKKMKGPVKDVEADNDSKEGAEAEEGKRSAASKSKFSKLQSLIFGSLQKFFKAQVR